MTPDREPRFWMLAVDLTGSKLGPTWRSVELKLDDVGWSEERIRREAAQHYEVPLGQVGTPRRYVSIVPGLDALDVDAPAESA